MLVPRLLGGKVGKKSPKRKEGTSSEWSVEETVYRQRDGSTLWQADANCQEHRILVWGQSQSGVWRAVSRMADRIQREN